MKDIIYIVEDDESIRELIKYAIESEGYEATAFDCAEDMLVAIDQKLPALLILDIMLPGIDGIETLKIIREKYRSVEIKIIMLTAKNSEINKVTGLNSGADDYITKPFSVLELLARVKAHLRRYSVKIDLNMLTFEGIKLNVNNRTVTADGNLVSLTNKEFEILNLLMKNVGSVLEREKLLESIWGYNYMGESRTVDIHIKNLRSKLGAYGDCIYNVRGIGYALKEKAK